MSVQLALLKSGEEVIADIKEFRDSDDELVSYLFKNPFAIKIKTSQLLIEEDSGSPKHEVLYYKWMSLSKDTDIIVDKDWIVCITDPLDSIKQSYQERMNGRRNDSNESSDGSGDAGSIGSIGSNQSGGGIEGTSDSSVVLNEQLDTGVTD
tara:strand:- start:516 stop:968 length:453 start_codon:yes stop_codon:yes gene_type:complete